MGKQKQVFTGDAAQLLREYEKMRSAQVKTIEQLNRLRQTADQANRQQRKSASDTAAANQRALGSLKSIAGGYLGIQGAIQLVNSELERKRQLEEQAKTASITVADAEANVIINLGDETDGAIKAFLEDIGQIRADTGFQSNAQLLNAASTTISATAGDKELTKDILGTTAQLFKSAPDELATAAQVVGDLAKTSDLNARKTTGLILSTMNQARIVSLESFKNVAPSIAAAVATQKNIAPVEASTQAAAAFAAVGQEIKDPDGTLTKGAVTALSVALERNFEIDTDKFNKLVDSGVSIKDAREQSALNLAQRLDKAQDIGERITSAINQGIKPADADIKKRQRDGETLNQQEQARIQLSNDQSIQADLLSKGFRGATVPVIRELLAGNDTKVAQSFDSALSKIKPDGGLVDRKIEQLNGLTNNLTIASQERKVEGAANAALSGSQAAVDGSVRSILEKAFKKTGSESFIGPLNSIQLFANSFNSGDQKAGHAIDLLEQRKSLLRGSAETIAREHGVIDTAIESIKKLRDRPKPENEFRAQILAIQNQAFDDTIRSGQTERENYFAKQHAANRLGANPSSFFGAFIGDNKDTADPLTVAQNAKKNLADRKLEATRNKPFSALDDREREDAAQIDVALAKIDRLIEVLLQTNRPIAPPEPAKPVPPPPAATTPATGAAAQTRRHDEVDRD